MSPSNSPASAATPITVRGPFWEADALVLEGSLAGSGAAKVKHLRTLFVEAHGRQGAAGLVHLPGTVLALVRIREVRVQAGAIPLCRWTRGDAGLPLVDTEAQITAALRSGDVSLVLLQAHPDDVAAGRQVWALVAGEFRVDPAADLSSLWSVCGLSAIDDCRAHASGLSVHAATVIPWRSSQPLTAWYMLTVDLPRANDLAQDAFRITFEQDRMTPAEIQALKDSWTALSRAVNPRHPRNGLDGFLGDTPTWVTFEVTDPTAAPNFYWVLGGGAAGRRLHLDPSEIAILLADQSPYAARDDAQPTSLAQVIPSDVAIETQGDRLRISASAGNLPPPAGAETLHYTWTRTAARDQFKCGELLLAFDPVQTAALVRGVQNVSPPTLGPANAGSETPRLDPPLVWGFMPLEDGWAQLPFPNFTEQVFIDLGLAASPTDEGEIRSSILQGGVTFGNDDPVVLAGFCDEQPWNVVLVAAQGAAGEWELGPDGSGGLQLEQVSLEISGPDLFFNGLVWLAMNPATPEDALPDLARWTSALAPVGLRTVAGAAEVFPSLMRLRLTDLGMRLRATVPALCGGNASNTARLGRAGRAYHDVRGERGAAGPAHHGGGGRRGEFASTAC